MRFPSSSSSSLSLSLSLSSWLRPMSAFVVVVAAASSLPPSWTAEASMIGGGTAAVAAVAATATTTAFVATGGVRNWTNRNCAAKASSSTSSSSSLSMSSLYTPSPNSLSGKTIVITGGTTGLGLESAKRLAMGGPDQLVITARTEEKGKNAVRAVLDYVAEKQSARGELESSEQTNVAYKILDLDDIESIKRNVPSQWDDVPKIDVLLNNAGIMAVSDRQLTADGYERQMQSNHLGHFVFTALLAQSSRFVSSARIINVSSSAHKIPGRAGLRFEYMWKGEPGYGAWKSYGQSKLANILFTQELQRRALASESTRGWTAVTMHPGAVATDLGRHMMGVDNFEKIKSGGGSFLQAALLKAMSVLVKTPEQGASTQIWLASGGEEKDKLDDVGGKYFVDCREESLADYVSDPVAAKRLWEDSEKLSGVTFDLNQIQAAPAIVPEEAVASVQE